MLTHFIFQQVCDHDRYFSEEETGMERLSNWLKHESGRSGAGIRTPAALAAQISDVRALTSSHVHLPPSAASGKAV